MGNKVEAYIKTGSNLDDYDLIGGDSFSGGSGSGYGGLTVHSFVDKAAMEAAWGTLGLNDIATIPSEGVFLPMYQHTLVLNPSYLIEYKVGSTYSFGGLDLGASAGNSIIATFQVISSQSTPYDINSLPEFIRINLSGGITTNPCSGVLRNLAIPANNGVIWSFYYRTVSGMEYVMLSGLTFQGVSFGGYLDPNDVYVATAGLGFFDRITRIV